MRGNATNADEGASGRFLERLSPMRQESLLEHLARQSVKAATNYYRLYPCSGHRQVIERGSRSAEAIREPQVF